MSVAHSACDARPSLHHSFGTGIDVLFVSCAKLIVRFVASVGTERDDIRIGGFDRFED